MLKYVFLFEILCLLLKKITRSECLHSENDGTSDKYFLWQLFKNCRQENIFFLIFSLVAFNGSWLVNAPVIFSDLHNVTRFCHQMN